MRRPLALAAVSLGLWSCRSPGAMHTATSAPVAAAPTPASIVTAAPASFQVDGVATWRGDATAAYSLIHDDICDPHALGVFSAAEPELHQRGLHAGFGVIVATCAAAGRWPEVRTLLAHGHDVFSHSWD